nr:c-type cytochrome [uncultured Roseateles sp.]
MKYRFAACLFAAASLAGTVQAQPKDWRAFDACMACHARDKALVGPAFAAIRERYAAQADAPELLADRILKGSSGRWGEVAMPPNASLSAEQALAAARWILATPKPAP